LPTRNDFDYSASKQTDITKEIMGAASRMVLIEATKFADAI
jgi:hypothetical protein